MSNESFISEFRDLIGAGVGVIMVRTKEPHRATNLLRPYAFGKGFAFHTWDMRDGWLEHDVDPTKPPVKHGLPDPNMGLLRIAGLPAGSNAWEGPVICVMHYMHPFIGGAGKPGHPPIIQTLKNYVFEFSETGQRLVLMVPDGYILPGELANDIPVLDFGLPSREEIRDILQNTVEASINDDSFDPRVSNIFGDQWVDTMVASATGMTFMEAETAFAKAIIRQREKWDTGNMRADAEEMNRDILLTKTEVIRRSEVLELMSPVPDTDIGGLDLLKAYIHARRRGFTPEAREFGADTPKGILLAGMPGTGKSLCGKATASILGFPLIKFDVGRCMGSLVGESEARVRSALKQLEAMAPVVALFDEVDKGLGGAHNSGGDSGVTKRVLGAILTFMQESEAPIYWMFTANRVNALPPELVRKGRLDDMFSIGFPTEVERREILRVHLAKRKQAIDGRLPLSVAASEGYVGSEIEAGVAEAVMLAFHDGVDVTDELIAQQFAGMRPLREAFPEDIREMREWAEANARPASSERVAKKRPAAVVPPGAARRRRISA